MTLHYVCHSCVLIHSGKCSIWCRLSGIILHVQHSLLWVLLYCTSCTIINLVTANNISVIDIASKSVGKPAIARKYVGIDNGVTAIFRQFNDSMLCVFSMFSMH